MVAARRKGSSTLGHLLGDNQDEKGGGLYGDSALTIPGLATSYFS